jgi:[ribosomal protein S18]-alanine N-acetyltransferase
MYSTSQSISQKSVRPYKITDFDDVLGLLQSNIPDFFDLNELSDFQNYLLHFREDYFVVEFENKIIAAGGVNYLPKEKLARLAWDMVRKNYHKKGLGAMLLNHRIKHIQTKTSYTKVDVRSSQFAFRFYEKQNFKLIHKIKDYWAPGFDLYHLSIDELPKK